MIKIRQRDQNQEIRIERERERERERESGDMRENREDEELGSMGADSGAERRHGNFWKSRLECNNALKM